MLLLCKAAYVRRIMLKFSFGSTYHIEYAARKLQYTTAAFAGWLVGWMVG